jgi:hypothetical protein
VTLPLKAAHEGDKLKLLTTGCTMTYACYPSDVADLDETLEDARKQVLCGKKQAALINCFGICFL